MSHTAAGGQAVDDMALIGLEYWDDVYRCGEVSDRPSSFAAFCEDHFLDDTAHIVDLGSGNGRDSFFFHDRGHDVTGIDWSSVAVEQCRRRAADTHHRERIQFHLLDLADLDADDLTDVDAVYTRMTLDAVDAKVESHLLDFAAEVLAPGGQLLLTARTVHDPEYGSGRPVGRHEFVSDRYRRFVEAEALLDDILTRGFELHFLHESDRVLAEPDDRQVVTRMALRRS